MKPNSIKLQLILLSAALLSACSGMKMASDELLVDDVYNTQVKAKEYAPYDQAPYDRGRPQNKYAIDSATYQEYLAELNYDPADMNYAHRINRFSYFNPWRAYYDGMYGYMPSHIMFDYSYEAYLSGRDYGLFPYYNNRFGFNLGITQFNAWFSPWSYWYRPFGPFNSFNYWGPLSMFDYYHTHPMYGNGMWGPFWGSPWYGGGFFGGGYYGGGMIGGINPIRNNPNYGARPLRGSENGIIYTPRAGAGLPSNNTVRPGSSMSGSRADRYEPRSGNTLGRGSSAPASSARPSRGNENTGPSRPTMSNPPPSRSGNESGSSSRGSSSGSSSSGSSSRGSSSGDGRPGRG